MVEQNEKAGLREESLLHEVVAPHPEGQFFQGGQGIGVQYTLQIQQYCKLLQKRGKMPKNQVF